jgi:hypothetical protein
LQKPSPSGAQAKILSKRVEFSKGCIFSTSKNLKIIENQSILIKWGVQGCTLGSFSGFFAVFGLILKPLQ